LPDLNQLRRHAREIFDYALASVDPRKAVLRAIVDRGVDVDVSAGPIYAIAIGKAASSMAFGLQDAIGPRLSAGIISAPKFSGTLEPVWKTFEGGHPLPNDESVAAAQAAFALLDRANDERAVVIFLVSGGGSAMMEYPTISLDDLRRLNELLIGCGARISEINAVRRVFSRIKGGRLAEYASKARIVTLIVSDTNKGDEANVASGPTLSPTVDSPYEVLLDNSTALEAARQKAAELGFAPTIAHDICEQPIQEGCDLLLRETADCVISGGEFSCPVRGNGVGGRNLETTLRLALRMSGGVVLSAGTDGIDGNSPAAGAIADATTIARARALGLNPNDFLARSDSYNFFEKLHDLVITGPTGTNVRDLRIILRTP
jgi:hydroxypyruvate reductase